MSNRCVTLSRWFGLWVVVWVGLWTGGVGVAVAQTTRPAAEQAAAERPDFGQNQFLRFTDDDVRPRLEVSIMTFRGEDGFEVDLVSAVHIGDESYFQDLNHRFDGYDAVLYELIKSRDAAPPVRGQRSGGAVSGLQRGMKAMLGLTFQLDEIDYQKDHFIHADMDVTEFFEAQRARGESMLGLMMNAYMRALTAPAPQPDPNRPVRVRPIHFGTTPAERQHALKTILAGMFDNLERQSLGLDSPEGSAILTDRNDAALKVLREVREQGRHRRVALFYGAAHMPDLARKMFEVDGLKPVNTEWVTAWDLTPPAKQAPPAQP